MSYVPDDTAPEIAALLTRKLAALSGTERLVMCSDLFDTARALILASRPDIQDARGQRLLLLDRLYPELDVPRERIPA